MGNSNQFINPNETKTQAKIERDNYLAQMKPLINIKIEKMSDNGLINIGFTSRGNKHLYNDTLSRTPTLYKSDLKDLDNALRSATFVKSELADEPRKDGITKFYYYKDISKELYYNVGETPRTYKNGKVKLIRNLHSVTNRIKPKKEAQN